MLDVLRRHDPASTFLDDGSEELTYGEVADLVASRRGAGMQELHPQPGIEAVIDLLAAMSSGTAVIDPSTSAPRTEIQGDTVTVVFTSGTTGPPKGVRLTSSNWASAAEASISHLGHGPDDSWILAMPMTHVAGIGIVIRSAYAGGRVRLMPGFEPVSFAAALHDATLASAVPTMLARVLDADPGPFSGQKAVLVGGGPIPPGLLERASAAGLPVLPTYGLTETCGQVATLRPGSPVDYKAHPLPGVELRIDESGRIGVKGGMVSPGYLGEPDRADSWLTTADLGILDDDGALRVIGRADDMIITGGENVSPAMVEAALTALDGVDEAVVIGVPSEQWGVEVGCVYTGVAGSEQVLAGVKASLPAHAVPKRALRVDSIPIIGPGKPDRSAVSRLLSG
jgi:O-succinylbenzoic acid--CoA ligase